MENILIVKLGALGDVVRTMYFLEGIKKKYPNSKIYWLTKEISISLLKFNNDIDFIINIESDIEIKKMEKIKFDWILSLEDEVEVLRVIKKICTDKLTGAFLQDKKLDYTKDSELWFDMGLISKYGKEKADKMKRENTLSHTEIFEKILNIKINKPNLKLYSELEDKEFVNLYIEKDKKNIGLNLNAGKRWPSKSLSDKEALELLKKLLKFKEYNIILLGGQDDYERNMELYINFQDSKNLKIFEPQTLEKFARMIKNIDILITSDTLALHLAIAQNIPTVSYYSATSAAEIDTFGLGEKIQSTAKDYCNYTRNADNSTITADRILEKLEIVLNLNE